LLAASLTARFIPSVSGSKGCLPNVESPPAFLKKRPCQVCSSNMLGCFSSRLLWLRGPSSLLWLRGPAAICVAKPKVAVDCTVVLLFTGMLNLSKSNLHRSMGRDGIASLATAAESEPVGGTRHTSNTASPLHSHKCSIWACKVQSSTSSCCVATTCGCKARRSLLSSSDTQWSWR